jgi:hypothetical protein
MMTKTKTETTTHMKGKLTNPQEAARRKLCLCTGIRNQKKKGNEMKNPQTRN